MVVSLKSRSSVWHVSPLQSKRSTLEATSSLLNDRTACSSAALTGSAIAHTGSSSTHNWLTRYHFTTVQTDAIPQEQPIQFTLTPIRSTKAGTVPRLNFLNDRFLQPSRIQQSAAPVSVVDEKLYAALHSNGNTIGKTQSRPKESKKRNAKLLRSFGFRYGYGLIDAAAAVAQSIGLPRFPNLPDLRGNRWGLDMVKVPEVWAKGYTGRGVVVAVLDSGVDYTHPDLKDNIWVNSREVADNGIDDDGNGFIDDVRGWNFADTDSNDPMDSDGHGTHVAGTIAASNNGFGVTGVAYGVKLMPVRVIGGNDDSSLAKFDANVAAGIRYAVQNGAKVISMSIGSNLTDAPMRQTEAALNYARQVGAIAIMASGNERLLAGATRPIEPAFYAMRDLGIAVGAVNKGKTVADFSNPAGNRRLDFVVAPGVNVDSTVLNGLYDRYTGTSMATPHVAGVVALMLSANPNLTPTQVETILTATAVRHGIKAA